MHPYLEGGFQLGIPVDSLLHGEVVQLMSQHDGPLLLSYKAISCATPLVGGILTELNVPFCAAVTSDW